MTNYKMNLEQARMYIERVTQQRIKCKELSIALNMDKANISKKLRTKSKLRTSQKENLEKYFSLKLPNNIDEEQEIALFETIKSRYNFTEEQIYLLKHFLNSGNYLKKAVFDVINKDLIQ